MDAILQKRMEDYNKNNAYFSKALKQKDKKIVNIENRLWALEKFIRERAEAESSEDGSSSNDDNSSSGGEGASTENAKDVGNNTSPGNNDDDANAGGIDTSPEESARVQRPIQRREASTPTSVSMTQTTTNDLNRAPALTRCIIEDLSTVPTGFSPPSLTRWKH